MAIFATNNGRQVPIGDDDAGADFEDDGSADQGEQVYDDGNGSSQDYTLDTSDSEDVALKASMLRAEERLVAGNYYNALIQADLFPGDDAEIAVKVQARVRQLVRRELEEMLGLRAPERPAGPVFDARFTDSDVKVLKILIEKMLAPKQPSAPSASPTVQGVTVSPQPAPAPVPKQPPRVAAVQVRPPAGPQVPKAPVAKPAPPKPQPQQAKPGTTPKKSATNPGAGDASNEQVKGVRRLNNGRMQRRMKLEGDDGSTTVITQDLTPQVVTPNRVPMPEGMNMTAASMAMAMATVQAQGSAVSRPIQGIQNSGVRVAFTPTE